MAGGRVKRNVRHKRSTDSNQQYSKAEVGEIEIVHIHTERDPRVWKALWHVRCPGRDRNDRARADTSGLSSPDCSSRRVVCFRQSTPPTFGPHSASQILYTKIYFKGWIMNRGL